MFKGHVESHDHDDYDDDFSPSSEAIRSFEDDKNVINTLIEKNRSSLEQHVFPKIEFYDQLEELLNKRFSSNSLPVQVKNYLGMRMGSIVSMQYFNQPITSESKVSVQSLAIDCINAFKNNEHPLLLDTKFRFIEVVSKQYVVDTLSEIAQKLEVELRESSQEMKQFGQTVVIFMYLATNEVGHIQEYANVAKKWLKNLNTKQVEFLQHLLEYEHVHEVFQDLQTIHHHVSFEPQKYISIKRTILIEEDYHDLAEDLWDLIVQIGEDPTDTNLFEEVRHKLHFLESEHAVPYIEDVFERKGYHLNDVMNWVKQQYLLQCKNHMEHLFPLVNEVKGQVSSDKAKV